MSEFKEYENLNFEDAMGELEKTVSKLEDPSSPLDKSLELYERGIFLVKKCNDMLSSAEQKVKIISLIDGKNATEEDFSNLGE